MTRVRGAAALVAALGLVVSACGGGAGHKPAPPPSPRVVYRLNLGPNGDALAAPVEREVAVADGSRVLLAGGLDAGGRSAAGVFVFDPSTGGLKALGSVPAAFHDAAGALIGGKLYVFGGGSASSTSAVQSFDPAARTGRVAGHLPIALSDLSATAVGNTVYLVGGWNGTTPQSAIYSTTDGRTFARAGALPVGLRYPAVAAAGGNRIVVAGGLSAGGPVNTVYSFDTASGKVSTIGHLPAPVAGAAAVTLDGRVYVIGGQAANGRAVASVTAVDPTNGSVRAQAPLARPISNAGAVTIGGQAWIFGGRRGRAVDQVLHATVTRTVIRPKPAGASPSASPSVNPAAVRPFAGLLVVADRGNNRLLVMNARKQIVWRYRAPNLPKPPYRFYFPDDAFWVHGGHAILVNEEENDTLIEIAYPSGQVLWSYGHPGVPGDAPGYTHQPDDLYPLPGGGLTVADAENCRILFFDAAGRPDGQIGQNRICVPNMPATVGYPNGDTPLANGDILVSQIDGAFIDRVTRTGHVIWQVHLPEITYPSDPQPMPNGRDFLAADFASPGKIVEFTPSGRILWMYAPKSGPGELDHPSLAAPMPNGLIICNDDYNDRVVIIDPATKRIVWQYGVKGRPGKTGGLINTPDGLDLLLPGGVVPMHVDFPSDATTPGRP